MKKTKVCGRCGERKHVTSFGYHKYGINNLHPNCKDCCREYQRERYKSGNRYHRKVNTKKDDATYNGKIVVSGGKLFEVCGRVSDDEHIVAVELVGHPVMSNGQVLKRTVRQLGTNWRMA